jgi:hypothetical protein
MANFTGFDNVTFEADCAVLRFFDVPGDIDVDAFKDAVSERIASGKKPAQTLNKKLGQIALHAEHLHSALVELFETYGRMVSTTPHQRTSAVTKARRAMLDSMSDKVLKAFAGDYIDVDNYIFPDDREDVVNAVLSAMAHKEPVA